MSSGLLFARIGEKHTFTWLNATDGKTLDIMYFLQHSSQKDIFFFGDGQISDEAICDEETITSDDLLCGFTDTTLTLLVEEVILKFKTKWETYHTIMEEQINALLNEDYMVTETPNLVTENDANANVETYGFNSSTEVPTGKGDNYSKITQTGNRTMTYKGRRGSNLPEATMQTITNLENNLYEQMMNDVDTLITLPIYSY